MDKKTRNLELEAWLIETTGEEMMSNHLGPNWNRFNDEFGFYPNMSMTIADQVWQHQQAKVEKSQTNAELLDSALQRSVAREEDLQKRVDLALLGVSGVMRWVEEDAIDDPDFIKGGVLSALRRLEQALKGEQQ